MKRLVFKNSTHCMCLLVLVGLSLSVLTFGADDKITPSDVIAKHLESLGSAEARAGLPSRLIEGTALLTIRQGGKGKAGGKVRLASQGSMNLLTMAFAGADYPDETLAYDGQKFTTTYFRPGQRSRLAQLFFTNDVLFKEGLVGGTLSSSWPFLNLSEHNPKLEYSGLKKLGDRRAHALRYIPRKGSDMKITLFFDTQTFQHLRTEYEQTISPSSIERIPGRYNPEASSPRASNARIKISEDFSNFKMEKGLNLPHGYKLGIEVQSELQPLLADWEFELVDFDFSQNFVAQQFVIKE